MVSGDDLAAIERAASRMAQLATTVPGVSSALAERLTGGRCVGVKIDRNAAGGCGLNIADVQALIAGTVGGENLTEAVEGLARDPVNLRHPHDWRDTPQRLVERPILRPLGLRITLGSVATGSISDGPPMIKGDNGWHVGWVCGDVHGRDLASVDGDQRCRMVTEIKLDPGTRVACSGQFECLARAKARRTLVVSATLTIIFVLLHPTCGRQDESVLVMAMLLFARTGEVGLRYPLRCPISVAMGVVIALAGVVAAFGAVPLLALKQALADRLSSAAALSAKGVDGALREGACGCGPRR